MQIKITLPPQERFPVLGQKVLDGNSFESGLSRIVIQPTDQLNAKEQFFVTKKLHSYQYATRTDFCKNILVAIPDRACIHIVSYESLTVQNFAEILGHDTKIDEQNIIYYYWDSGRENLGHVSVIYIDKKNKRIYYMPDRHEFNFQPVSVQPLQEIESQFGYCICFPAGIYFYDHNPTLQKDDISCSFISHQMAQKLETINRVDHPHLQMLPIPHLTTLVPELIELQIEKDKIFTFSPFKGRLPFYPFVYPDLFNGITQRKSSNVLNHYILDLYFKKNPGLKKNIASPILNTKKKINRELWIKYFGIHFRDIEHSKRERLMIGVKALCEKYFKFKFDEISENKYEKMLQRLKKGDDYKEEYNGKTSPIRKVWDLNQMTPENKSYSIEIARVIFQTFKVFPTNAFFEAIGVLDGVERQGVLDKIAAEKLEEAEVAIADDFDEINLVSVVKQPI